MNRFENYRTKIMLTGDSITEGDGNASAYRYQLFKRLYAAGAAFEFVGENTSGDLRLPHAYYKHGGYCGITVGIDEDNGLIGKFKNKPEYAEAAKNADIIVLWIGYNDYGRDIDLDHISDRVVNYIAKCHELNPDVSIYVGTLFNYKAERPLNAWILDPATKTMLEEKFPGLRYTGVDMNVGENRLSKEDGDFPEDDGHPNEKGNSKIAESWYRAIIDEVLEISRSKPAECEAPVRVKSIKGDVRPVTLKRGEGVTFTASVLPEDAEVNTILWESSNPKAATVDDYGRVMGVSEGRAVITATTLDCGFSLSAEVMVTGIGMNLGAHMKKVYESDFTDPEKWTGPKDVFSPEFNKLGYRYNRTKTGELTLNEEIPCNGDFLLSFTLRVANDRTHGTARHIELKYAGAEMRISADAGYIMLFENGEMLGQWHTIAPAATDDRYAMKREGSVVSLYRNNEFLFAASTNPIPGDKLVIAWNDMSKSSLRDIVISVKK